MTKINFLDQIKEMDQIKEICIHEINILSLQNTHITECAQLSSWAKGRAGRHAHTGW